jgi:phosphatidylserine decarboxylase
MSERAASAKRTNHPLTSQRQTGRKGFPCENAKNVCSGGFVVFARNRKQNANLQLENGSSQMRNVHAFNARSIVAACATKRKVNCGFLVNNPQGMLQTAYDTIVTGSVAAVATRKQATRNFLMRYGIWM